PQMHEHRDRDRREPGKEGGGEEREPEHLAYPVQSLARGEVGEQRVVQWRGRVHERVVHPILDQHALERGDVVRDQLAVARAYVLGDHRYAHAGLEVLEVGRVLEREFELRLIQHVEDDDVVPAVAQAPHGATYHVRLLVEVRNEDEDAAAAVVLGELREWSAELARLAGAGAVERVQDEIEASGGGWLVLA